MFKIVKRGFDFLSASVLFILILPLFALICALVKINLGSPIFFVQERSGRHQKKFNMIKFRTMKDERGEDGVLLPDEERQTPFGSFLRSTSLDELPELLLIIKGDMSVIGPRPLPPSYDVFFTERELHRFQVRGGLLPPDSVETSAMITWDKQLEIEAQYAENLSFLNDLNIFFSALRMILIRRKTDYGEYVRKTLIEERSIHELQHK